ncbi:SGNH/GDSL hydrolase family protein [Polaribacter sp.]|uniref:SGNH/GDSL hydrolase family protein n=1 Tax=Polaribacter sp. TaxID=1920175 RepID=UPI003F6AC9BB
MRLNKIFTCLFFSIILLFSCENNSESAIIEEEIVEEIIDEKIRILSLGDSYTIGQSVCDTCSFPKQLTDSLRQRNDKLEFNLKVIATTGWTTRNLISAIENENLDTNFNLVTLLIGVNNQYQNLPFSTFEKEFPTLINKAINAVGSDKSKLIVLSIPDYAFTPFGNGNTKISIEIEQYNAYIKSYCLSKNITFLNITEITKTGLINTDFVARDGLHPSEKAYTEFVKLLLPLASQKLGI